MSELVHMRVVYIDGNGGSDLLAYRLRQQSERLEAENRRRTIAAESPAVPATDNPGAAVTLDPEQVREISERNRAQLLASPAFRNSRAGRRLMATRPELFPDLNG